MDVTTKAALSPQLLKDPECWSGRSRTHDLPHGSPVLNQMSHRCAVVVALVFVLLIDVLLAVDTDIAFFVLVSVADASVFVIIINCYYSTQRLYAYMYMYV